MTSTTCHTKNLLVRDGTSQAARYMAALDPDFVQVDERSLLDQIRLLRKYARLVQYHSDRNEADGDWENFFNSGMASLVALITDFSMSEATAAFKQLKDDLEAAGSNKNKIRRIYKSIFDLLFTLMYQLEQWQIKAEEGTLLRKELRRHIGSTLRNVFAESLSYFKEAKKNPKISATAFHDVDFTNFPTTDANEVLQVSFDEIWSLNSTLSWEDYLNSNAAEPGIFQPYRSDVEKAAAQGLKRLEKLLEKILGVYRQLTDQGEALLKDLLENYPAHQPHMTLMLSFFQLLDSARAEINTLTSRHLDFYYKRVLRLDQKAAVPDTVHLVFELAKHVEEALVKEDTEVKAGKDATGVERIYETDSELVANQAQVVQMRSVFISGGDASKVYSAEVTNSADGAGAEFEDENPKWKAFGKDQAGLAADERSMADARVGFAVSSYDFFLQEGKRVITLTITCKKKPDASLSKLLTQGLQCRLTAEEEWLSIEPEYYTGKGIESINSAKISGNDLILKLTLTKDLPPIVGYDPELHGPGYSATTPVLEILAKHGKSGNSYELLSSLEPTEINLQTHVTGLKDVVLQNDASVIDTSKPFEFFGPQPIVGSSIYIGSTEMMGKDLTSLSIRGTWLDHPTDFGTHYTHYDSDAFETEDFKVIAENLENGEWTSDNLPTSTALFQEDSDQVSSDFEISLVETGKPELENDPLEEEVTKFTSDSERGFLRLRLIAPAMAFGHKAFPHVMQKKAVELAALVEPDTSLLPLQPYTPLLTDFTVEYRSQAEASFGLSSEAQYRGNELKLFSIQPFGQKELHPFLGSKNLRLAPEFRHSHKGKTQWHEGEFYIGIEKLDPPQNLSLLIQVAEGSEDPKLPTTQVHWHYLDGNEWVEFETQEILQDSTNGLLKSGILSLAIPREADLEHNIFPAGLHWVKASMEENTAAVCDVIDIRAQAVSATFDDRGNDPEHLKSPLPAENASKLVNRIASTKSVAQPYASFGGRVKEQPLDFYRRVSERLRHKDRGVSIWDYERLVLEEFPELHKVKCINHSTYGYDAVLDKDFDSEFAPGYLSLVMVPDLNNQNAINPYEPAVSKAKLEDVKTYLQSVMPSLVLEKIKVLNALYEQIQVEMEVEFYQGYDRGFYEKQINTDIKKLLAPWAFGNAQDILFGGKIYRSTIINFVEEREYVDYVKNFKMHHYVEGKLHNYDISEAFPTTSRSIFVSINDKDPAKEHIIKEMTECK